MFKILIVDDEENTREGLKRIIPWKELGIDEVYEAEDGVEALLKFKSVVPDIIICDIHMPKMDGIGFVEKVRETNSRCKIIFLSGYCDKEYLKSAIRLGAVEYIEKPIVLVELKDILRKTVELLKEEIIHNDGNLKNIKQVSMINQKQALLLKLIERNMNVEKLQQEYSAVFDFNRNKDNYTVICVYLSWKQSNDVEKCSRIRQTLLKDINSGHTRVENEILSEFKDNTCLIILLKECLKEYTKSNDDFSQSVKNVFLRYEEDLCFSVGIGEPARNLEGIAFSYETALIAAKKVFFSGFGKFSFYKDINEHKYNFEETNYLLFEKYLFENRRSEAIELIEGITSGISRNWGTNINYIKDVYIKLYRVICNVTEKVVSRRDSERTTPEYFWKHISEMETLEETTLYLIEKIENYYSLIDDAEPLLQKVKEIITFIHGHYRETTLTVTAIADKVHLSLHYMCGFFKKHTGKTINEYINEVRLEKACEMLIDRENKIYEIAISVGFDNSNYFTRLFKKKKGVSPKTYREKYLK